MSEDEDKKQETPDTVPDKDTVQASDALPSESAPEAAPSAQPGADHITLVDTSRPAAGSTHAGQEGTEENAGTQGVASQGSAAAPDVPADPATTGSQQQASHGTPLDEPPTAAATEVPEHEVPHHDIPQSATGDIPPHEVPHHDVPPVNSQQAPTPPQTPHAAADPNQMVDPNVVNQAVDVIANSNSQKQAVHQAFELQKASIAHGIRTRREAAMEQAAAAKVNIGQQTATAPQQGATPMNQQYAAGAPHPQAMPGQQYQAAPQPGMATHPGMAGYAGAAPLSQNEIIAQEFATTIRQMIAQEVDKQLKALLAAYTNAEAQKTESSGE